MFTEMKALICLLSELLWAGGGSEGGNDNPSGLR